MWQMRRQAKSGVYLTSRETRTRAASFMRGFIDGVGGVAALSESVKATAPRKYEGRGIKGDWIAVGESIRRATGKG